MSLQPQAFPRLRCRQRAHDGYGLAVAAYPHAEHTEPVLGIVEGDALDRAFQAGGRATIHSADAREAAFRSEARTLAISMPFTKRGGQGPGSQDTRR